MVGGGGVVSLAAGLGGKGEGDLVTAGLSNDGLDLVNCVGAVSELGHIEASLLNLVLALDLSDLDGLGDTHLLGGGVGEGAGELQGGGDQGDLVGLGLVFLLAHLVLSTIAVVLVSIASSATGGHLHGLRLLLIGDLGGGAGGSHGDSLVLVGADLPVHGDGGLLAHCQHSVEAVVLILDNLDGELYGGDLVSEGGDTDLGVD